MVDADRLSGRVGMIVHAYYPWDSRVRRAAEQLAAAGIEVHVVCLRDAAGTDGKRVPKREIIRGVHVHRLGLSKKRGGKLRYFVEFAAITIIGMLKLAQLHLRKRFNVIHIHNMPDLLVFAGLIPKLTGARLVLDVHDPMSELFQANYRMEDGNFMIRAIRLQERLSYKFADHLMTVSHPMAENVAQKADCCKADVVIVQNLPDRKTFPMGNEIRWPRHEAGFVVLYAGTVTDHYRLDIAVRAIAIASKSIPSIRLNIVGDGNRIEQVLDLAKELSIAERVTHLKPVRHQLVKDLMAEADVGISTHQAGAFGDLYFSNKIVEFLTQGLPVVISRTKTITYYLPDDALFFCEPESPEGCADQLMTIWSNPNCVIQKLTRARKIAEQLNWDSEKKNLLQLYQKLLSN